jgi:hypothetical protein
LGGVGYFFGGLLAKAFESDAIEIVLLHVAETQAIAKMD